MRNFFKAMMVVAFVAVVIIGVNVPSVEKSKNMSEAQNAVHLKTNPRVIDGANMSEAQIALYLKTNSNDTVKVFVSQKVGNDTLSITNRLYYKDGERFVTHLHKEKYVQNGELMSVLVNASADNRFKESFYDSRRRDVYYYFYVEGLPGVMGV